MKVRRMGALFLFSLRSREEQHRTMGATAASSCVNEVTKRAPRSLGKRTEKKVMRRRRRDVADERVWKKKKKSARLDGEKTTVN